MLEEGIGCVVVDLKNTAVFHIFDCSGNTHAFIDNVSYTEYGIYPLINNRWKFACFISKLGHPSKEWNGVQIDKVYWAYLNDDEECHDKIQ